MREKDKKNLEIFKEKQELQFRINNLENSIKDLEIKLNDSKKLLKNNKRE